MAQELRPLRTIGKVPATVDEPRLKSFLESMRQRMNEQEERIRDLEAQVAINTANSKRLIWDSGFLETAANSINARNLEPLNPGESYHIEFYLRNNSSANVDYYVSVNGEDTATGYRHIQIYGLTSTGNAQLSSYTSMLYAWGYNNGGSIGSMIITLDSQGAVTLNSDSTTYNGTHIEHQKGGGFKDNVISGPVTELQFSSGGSAGNRYGVGTRIKIYKHMATEVL